MKRAPLRYDARDWLLIGATLAVLLPFGVPAVIVGRVGRAIAWVGDRTLDGVRAVGGRIGESRWYAHVRAVHAEYDRQAAAAARRETLRRMCPDADREDSHG